MTTKFDFSGFGRVSLKNEGDIINPDEFSWECNLDECEKCRDTYFHWKQKYMEQEEKRDALRTK